MLIGKTKKDEAALKKPMSFVGLFRAILVMSLYHFPWNSPAPLPGVKENNSVFLSVIVKFSLFNTIKTEMCCLERTGPRFGQ